MHGELDEFGIKQVVLALKRDDPEGLFVLLAAAGLDNDRQRFVAAASSACDISPRGFEVMLENNNAEASWRLLYRQSRMPSALFPIFYDLIQYLSQPHHAPLAAGTLRTAIVRACRQVGLPEAHLEKLNG